MLENDDEDEIMSKNYRNCILIRKSEKEVLEVFKECEIKAGKVLNMTPENALKEILSWESNAL